MAVAYAPIISGCLGVSAAYYALIALSHPFYEKGAALVVLTTLAAVACLSCLAGFLWMRRRLPKFRTLEVFAVLLNGQMLLNVATYQTAHLEPSKLVYFVLMCLLFAGSSPSRRIAFPCIGASLILLEYFATKADAATCLQYRYVGIAAAFSAIGMSIVMRGAIDRSVNALIAAEALNLKLDQELRRNEDLHRKAIELARGEQAANRAKSEFLATISHEIRTPLNGVLGMAQAMSADPLSRTQRRRLETIQNSGKSLLKIINNVLDISKIEAGRVELSPVAFDLRTFVDELGELYGALARDKGLDFQLELELGPGASSLRFGDETRLRQVFSNLLSNAVKFTSQGRIEVLVTAEADTLRFTVSDTGIGIAPHQSDRLFEGFVQADSSMTRKFGGSGLGLSICREIVRMMGGEIAFTSWPGQGTSFSGYLVLPEASVSSTEGDADLVVESGGLRVLAVDDHATNRLVFETMLRQMGMTCVAVESAEQAIHAFEAGGWDLVLMDIHMPDMDGMTATRELRRIEAARGLARTPIIAVTASVLAHETDAYLKAGMDDIVPKPLEGKVLLQVVQRLLARDEQACSAA
eukprot:gene16812-16993_t